MFGYRIVLLVAGALLVLGVGYAAFSSDEMTPERAIATGEVIRMEADRDAAISRWATARGLEFVPAPRGNEPARPVNVVTGREATPEEIAEAGREPSEFEVQRPARGRSMTIVADPDGGPAKVIYEERSKSRRRNGRLSISSLRDLMRLNVDSDDRRRLEKGEVDVDLYRLRDDVNNGLFGLGATIRRLDQSYVVPGVRSAGAPGVRVVRPGDNLNATTGEMSWAPGVPVHEGTPRRRTVEDE